MLAAGSSSRNLVFNVWLTTVQILGHQLTTQNLTIIACNTKLLLSALFFLNDCLIVECLAGQCP